MNDSIKLLSNISSDLSQAPNLTRDLIDDTKKASDDITESYKNLEKMFVEGVGQIANVYMSKIQQVEDHAKNITKAYEGASGSLSEAIEPISELSENIENLIKVIKNESFSLKGKISNE